MSRRNTASDAHNPGRMHSRRNTATSDSSLPPTPVHISPAAAMSALMTKMNTRPKTSANSLPSPPQSANPLADRSRSMQAFSGPRTGIPTSAPMMHGGGMENGHARSRSNTGSLRSFRLQASAMAGGMNRRGDALLE
ncbi:hypothetical protein K505DRAFT_44743 [Melanomma pulvis-pyrius CBS 109.77]|uniref:Uncharacterized protein n=1 Tax=Melanomma pulvis-pyrius CBS 109.77 TaxID=1314802 RepID=A0A6A6XB02_9PLEO|nr:hypothetical protein K505DRAFT_44743 [Melanomma pulvis-pyrius CBS 109.77]